VTDVTPIAEKVAKLVCQFDSDNANQRAMAWKALVHTLRTVGADFRDLGNLIECAGKNGDGEFKYTESDMQGGYEAGIKEGEKRAAYLHSQNARGQFRGTAQLRFPLRATWRRSATSASMISTIGKASSPSTW
jgi:hypothetical protein